MTRLFDLLYKQLENAPFDKSLSTRNAQGEWYSYSTQQLVDTVEKTASGLLALGLKPGDKVGIVVYKNRPEFLIIDFALQMTGMVSIPLYPTISVGEYEYILSEAEVKAAFCGSGDLYTKLNAAKQKVSSLEHIFTFDKQENNPFWEDIFSDEHAEQVMHVVKETEPHMAANVGDNVLSFLPLCHIFERAVSMVYIHKGVKVFFAGTDNLSGPDGDLMAVKPVTFSTVPRLLEKIYEAIYNKGLALEGAKKKIFFWALNLTDDWKPERH